MFYEFNDYPYYALIKAKSEKEAISFYEEEICEIDKESKSCPDILAKEHVIEKIKNIKNASEFDKEKLIEELDFETEEPCLILIDGFLI